MDGERLGDVPKSREVRPGYELAVWVSNRRNADMKTRILAAAAIFAFGVGAAFGHAGK